MARITVKDVLKATNTTEVYDIANAIRNSGSSLMQDYVPLANAENVAEFGTGLLLNQQVQNEFITSLVDRIGLVIIRSVSLANPLAKFKRGKLENGRTIQEVFVDLAKSQLYDAEESEEKVFKRVVPNVKTLYHERNRQEFYQQTIQDESLRSAFVSWDTFGSFIGQLINSIYNAAEVDEYKYMKLLIDNYYSKGLFRVEKISDPSSSTASATEFIKKIRATAMKMTLPMGSRDFNSLAVRTRTHTEDLHLFIDADLHATVDVDVLAKAFNMDRTSFIGNITVIDGFASQGLEAVLVDSSFFMVYDNLQRLETIRNPRGLYWNYFFHVWQTLSVSRFANAVAFVSGEVAPVTQVIVDPIIANVKAGKEMQLNAFVRQTDDTVHTVTWSVANSGGGAVANGTSINANGLLTVGESQTSELTVTATVEYNIGTEEVPELETVTGTSIITVTPVLQ